MLSAKRLQSLLCLLCLAVLGCLCAPGQNQETPLPSLLTPESQAVLDKLASLSALPAPDWRYPAREWNLLPTPKRTRLLMLSTGRSKHREWT